MENTFKTLREAVDKDAFEVKTQYPPFEMVRSERLEKVRLWKLEDQELQRTFQRCLCGVIMNELSCNLGQAKLIYAHAWDAGHSNGYTEVIGEAEGMVYLFKGFAEAGKVI